MPFLCFFFPFSPSQNVCPHLQRPWRDEEEGGSSSASASSSSTRNVIIRTESNLAHTRRISSHIHFHQYYQFSAGRGRAMDSLRPAVFLLLLLLLFLLTAEALGEQHQSRRRISQEGEVIVQFFFLLVLTWLSHIFFCLSCVSGGRGVCVQKAGTTDCPIFYVPTSGRKCSSSSSPSLPSPPPPPPPSLSPPPPPLPPPPPFCSSRTHKNSAYLFLSLCVHPKREKKQERFKRIWKKIEHFATSLASKNLGIFSIPPPPQKMSFFPCFFSFIFFRCSVSTPCFCSFLVPKWDPLCLLVPMEEKFFLLIAMPGKSFLLPKSCLFRRLLEVKAPWVFF